MLPASKGRQLQQHEPVRSAERVMAEPRSFSVTCHYAFTVEIKESDHMSRGISDLWLPVRPGVGMLIDTQFPSEKKQIRLVKPPEKAFRSSFLLWSPQTSCFSEIVNFVWEIQRSARGFNLKVDLIRPLKTFFS